MDYKVTLTDEQRAILEGSKGETLAKVMESLVRYGELFGATEMVPISSKYNHLVTSFGLKALGPVYELMDKLLEAGAPSGQKFTVDPKPLDKNVPSSFAQDVVSGEQVRDQVGQDGQPSVPEETREQACFLCDQDGKEDAGDPDLYCQYRRFLIQWKIFHDKIPVQVGYLLSCDRQLLLIGSLFSVIGADFTTHLPTLSIGFKTPLVFSQDKGIILA